VPNATGRLAASIKSQPSGTTKLEKGAQFQKIYA
jgi:hypothetical protein